MISQNNKSSIGRMVLKPGILELIKTDQELLGKVAKEMTISTQSVLRIIRNRHINKKEEARLTQVGVLNVIKDHIVNTKDIEELVESELVDDKATS